MTEGMETTTCEPSKGESSGCGQTGCAGCLFFTLCLFLVLGFIAALSDLRGDLTAPITALCFLLPTLVGSGLALVPWSNSQTPLTVLKWILLLAVPVIPIAAIIQFSRPMGESVLIALAALVFVMFAWFPQVAMVLLFFHLRRPGGGLTRRFSLRTFLIAVTLLSVVLAGVGVYVKSAYGFKYRCERVTHFDPEDWPLRQDITTTEKEELQLRLSRLLRDRIEGTIEERNYREVTFPAELGSRKYLLRGDESELDVDWYCYIRTMPNNEGVYVVLKVLHRKLVSVETGTVQVGWRGGRSSPAKPATQLEHDILANFLNALSSSVWRPTQFSPDPLAGAEARIQEVEIADSKARAADE